MKNSKTLVDSGKCLRLPFVFVGDLSSEDVDLWRSFYENPIVLSRDSTIEEGLWRRTQEECNQDESGWRSEDDKRRRMVHYWYRYALVEDDLRWSIVLSEMYLWWHICMPEMEVAIFEEHIRSGLHLGRWRTVYALDGQKLFKNGDIYLRLHQIRPTENHYDHMANRRFPDDYCILEATVFSAGMSQGDDFVRKPWKVLSTGIRRKDVRGNPVVDDWDAIKNLLPAQVELGCGPSIEAGIPPLHFLHDVYCVTDKGTGRFILDPYKDSLIRRFAEDPGKMLMLFSEMYRKCFTAQPTRFHLLLKELYENGSVVGPIITNNFDGLVCRLGLQELYVRRYDESHIIPDVEFHPAAKSLIVVGSHADRRRIQHAAREKGLPVAYIDPEGYQERGGFRPYLLESPQDNDFLFRTSAIDAMDRIVSIVL